jgi:hypothetical protein
MFLGLLDPDPNLLSLSKNSKKNLDFYCFVIFFYFFSLKNDVNEPSKIKIQKIFFSNYFFVGVLNVNDENSRIRIRTISQRHGSADPDLDPHQNVWIRNTGQKINGKGHLIRNVWHATLLERQLVFKIFSKWRIAVRQAHSAKYVETAEPVKRRITDRSYTDRTEIRPTRRLLERIRRLVGRQDSCHEDKTAFSYPAVK